MDAASHLVRRSKRAAFAAAAPHFVAVEQRSDRTNDSRAMQQGLRKRLTPEQIEAMQASARASAIKAASEAAARTATTATTPATQRVGSPVTQPAVSSHPAYAFSDKFAATSTAARQTVITSSSAVRQVASSAAPSVASASSSTTRVTSSSTSRSTAAASTSTAAPLTSTATVRTITQTPSTVAAASSSAPSASADASAAAAASGSKDEGVSTGTIAGIVVGVLVGVVLVGSFIGWLYRKRAKRSYSDKAPWSKINDDDITPFPPNEKYDPNDGQDDIYGASAAPVIGSRRALAMARQNAFQDDGSFRPASDYMFTEEGANRAGVGSGGINHGYGAYPNLPSPYYGLDPQGRPYNPDASRSPMPHMYSDVPHGSPHAITAPGNTRQLVGPHGFPQPELSPHSLGRPAPPISNFAIAQHEDFADMPEPHTPTNVDGGDQPYTPQTAASMGEWAGDARHPQDRSRVSMSTPRALGAGAAATLAAASHSPSPYAHKGLPAASPASLPSFEPMSPLMDEFDLRRNSGQPLAMYEDEKTQQKRLYGEVAAAANFPEPPTPKTGGLMDSTSSTETTSSFSAHDPMPSRLPPAIAVRAPQPYIHGRPLSPLAEVQTPMSVATRPSMDYPLPSSSLLHEQNPYERTLLAAKTSPAPPYSAASTTGASGIPSPAYPPPSPSGMSVPGSVTDSPQRWESTNPRGRRVPSMFDEEDAYGGI